MKNKIFLLSIILLFSIFTMLLIINNKQNNKTYEDNNTNLEKEDTMEKYKVVLTVNNKELDIELEDNSTVNQLIEILKQKELIIKAYDYGNFEKVGNLGYDLITNDEEVQTEYGDIVLYQGNKISLFYNSNNWSYTKLGHIKNIDKEQLINLLGDSDVILKFTLK